MNTDRIPATYRDAYTNFINDRPALENAIISSTRASWVGSGYSVEFFADGSWRVLANNEIGNRYGSPGLILPIPPLTDDEYDPDYEEESYFEAAIEQVGEIFADAAYPY